MKSIKQSSADKLMDTIAEIYVKECYKAEFELHEDFEIPMKEIKKAEKKTRKAFCKVCKVFGIKKVEQGV